MEYVFIIIKLCSQLRIDTQHFYRWQSEQHFWKVVQTFVRQR
jgi:hypothetical protein